MVLSLLLAFESVWNGVWVAGTLPNAVVYDATALTLLAIRGLICSFQGTAAFMLLNRHPAGARFGQVALVASALALALELGFALAPTNVFPSFRWPMVGAYCVYAAAGVWWLRRFDGGR
jgi:hypothetical protein